MHVSGAGGSRHGHPDHAARLGGACVGSISGRVSMTVVLVSAGGSSS